MTDERPDPDQLLAQVKAQRGVRAARPAAHLLRRIGGRRQDLRDADRGARAARTKARTSSSASLETHGRKETEALLQGLEILPRAKIAYQDRTLRRIRSRCGARAPPGADPRRRARAHQRAGLAPSEALAGHRRAAGRRHRRVHDAQRPAPREPERRRRRHHRHQRLGDGARHVLRPGRRSRAGRRLGRRPARAAEGRQGVPARADRARRRATSSARAT